MNVALLGFGTVGQAVARLILASSAPLTLTHICNRQVARKRVDWVPSSVAWTERFEDLLGPDVDLIVEVIGGLDPAGRYHRAAIAAKKSVVTANKQLIAHEGGELLRLASQQGVALRLRGRRRRRHPGDPRHPRGPRRRLAQAHLRAS